ncbi:MAG: MarR family winged helix-turn-helix transcriptional regulator [Eubacteriaceae bacterium]
MEIRTDCGLLIKHISDAVGRKSNNQLRKDELTMSQMRFLGYLNEQMDRKVPLKELESEFEVAQSTVAGIISRLEKKEFVITEQNENDARAKNVYLSEKGQDLIADAEVYRIQSEDMLTAPLTEEETGELKRLLMKVYLATRTA